MNSNNMVLEIAVIGIIGYIVVKILLELLKYILIILAVVFILYNFLGQKSCNFDQKPVEYTTETTVVDKPITHDDFVGMWQTKDGVLFAFNADSTVNIGPKLDGKWYHRKQRILFLSLHGINEVFDIVEMSDNKMVLHRRRTNTEVVLFKVREEVHLQTN